MAQQNPYTTAFAGGQDKLSSLMPYLAPDLSVDQQQLNRRQQMAALLRQQGMEPSTGTEMVSGWAVKKPPMEYLNKIASALGGAYLQNKNDAEDAKLKQAYAQRLGFGEPTQSPQVAQETPGGMSVPSAPQPAQSGPSDKYAMGNLIKSLMIGDVGGQPAASAFWDDQKKTEAQKVNEYLGVDTANARQLELAKRLKDGTQALLPGQTNVLPNGSKLVAPNFETGVAGRFDGQGNPFASQIPGSLEVAANKAGMIKRQELGAADLFAVPTPVNTPNGPVAMTPAQQRSAANGGVDPAARQPWIGPEPKGAFSGDPTAILKSIQSIPDPAERAGALRAFQNQTGANTQPQGSATGMPLKDNPQIPEAAVKEQQSLLEKIGTVGSINADLGAVAKQIDSGKLKLGPVENIISQGKNALGSSDENSRNYATFKSTLEKLRNDSLRLNNGVQTEGDAQRAWNEVMTNINDSKYVSQRLAEIQKINYRAANLHKISIDTMRRNYSAPSLDTTPVFNQPPAVGSQGEFSDAEKERRYQAWKASQGK